MDSSPRRATSEMPRCWNCHFQPPRSQNVPEVSGSDPQESGLSLLRITGWSAEPLTEKVKGPQRGRDGRRTLSPSGRTLFRPGTLYIRASQTRPTRSLTNTGRGLKTNLEGALFPWPPGPAALYRVHLRRKG